VEVKMKLGLPPELRVLFERFNELARLLPQGDEIARAAALENPQTRAEARLILAEIVEVLDAIDAFQVAHGLRPYR
jgi:hypothetical protein